ncbi:hypothetical protein RIF25_12895 [Thermosynechococcaceae cyanobacterium BACA0444]|uniref:Uncharacterized protein n=1 Tax=Pseudocalidococcus azoricus BACA0444 TaxID=2918990 RepID=A0AAE4FVJ1_9CYAN|nr:hypothetical protein [Pseudocalidococcus azoricus]MDS3861700.1 hypothetical protein [Pseudocalidococcus azoricus BACA0444]
MFTKLNEKKLHEGQRTRERILSALESHEVCDRNTLCKMTNLSYSQVRIQTANLVQSGVIKSFIVNKSRFYKIIGIIALLASTIEIGIHIFEANKREQHALAADYIGSGVILLVKAFNATRASTTYKKLSFPI